MHTFTQTDAVLKHTFDVDVLHLLITRLHNFIEPTSKWHSNYTTYSKCEYKVNFVVKGDVKGIFNQDVLIFELSGTFVSFCV